MLINKQDSQSFDDVKDNPGGRLVYLKLLLFPIYPYQSYFTILDILTSIQEITPKANETGQSRNFSHDKNNTQSFDKQTDDNHQVVPNFGNQRSTDALTNDVRNQISTKDPSINSNSISISNQFYSKQE